MPFLVSRDGRVEVPNYQAWQAAGQPPTQGMSAAEVRQRFGGAGGGISTGGIIPGPQSSTPDQGIPPTFPGLPGGGSVTVGGPSAGSAGQQATGMPQSTGDAELDLLVLQLANGTISPQEAQKDWVELTGGGDATMAAVFFARVLRPLVGTNVRAREIVRLFDQVTAPHPITTTNPLAAGSPAQQGGAGGAGVSPDGRPVTREEAIAGQEQDAPFAAGLRALLQRPGFGQAPMAFQQFAQNRLGDQFRQFNLTSPFGLEGQPASPFSQFVGQGGSPSVGDLRSGLGATLSALLNPMLADPRSTFLRTQFQDPQEQAMAAIQPWLQQIAPSMRGALAGGVGRLAGGVRQLAERQQALQPERQFLDFARQSGWF